MQGKNMSSEQLILMKMETKHLRPHMELLVMRTMTYNFLAHCKLAPYHL